MFTSWAQGSDTTRSGKPATFVPHYYLTRSQPFPYITRVFRCGVEDGELVGKFWFVEIFLLTFFCARIQIYMYRIGCNGTLGLLQIGDAITRRISNVLSNRVSVIIHFQALSFYLLDN